ncbi:methyltransferase domain-containing protein [Streptomyces sp. NBC_00820]|uniref:methyltransferase domain-containing protein n=1 Tax=Streptomyces sp. NBC_00820 TaxID=2975842 RepID=UPI002ED0BB6E|nr:methyltransferase domain-containing protein [Streptomyces sp. NBC_00820]
MIQIVEHTQQEGPYAVGTALEAAGLPVRICRTWAGDRVPDTADGMMALVVLDGPMTAYEDFPGRGAELALLRAVLDAEVPVLGVCLGAHLLAVAAGGTARPGVGARIGTDARIDTDARLGRSARLTWDDARLAWDDVRMTAAVSADPLFAALPERLRVPHRHRDTVDLPAGTTLLAACDGGPAQAFRIGGSAWGLRFQLGVEDAAAEAFAGTSPGADSAMPGPPESAPGEPASLARYRDGVFERFAAFVAERAEQTATRAFFTRRAAAWDERFADDNPRYAAAAARMGLSPGGRVLDVGCGTGRVLPALRGQVGVEGLVLGVDLTPAMLTAAVRGGRERDGHLLLADACRLPLPDGAVDGVFSAGLINHVPDPAAALREWARVTARDGVLLLFHPSGRAERAARHGRRHLDPDDPLAEENLRPALQAAGWHLASYEDAPHHFLARAVRFDGRFDG